MRREGERDLRKSGQAAAAASCVKSDKENDHGRQTVDVAQFRSLILITLVLCFYSPLLIAGVAGAVGAVRSHRRAQRRGDWDH